MTLITFTVLVNDVPANATSVKFSDPTGTYGLKRTDTSEVLIADGTNLTNVGAGQYQYNLTDPEPGLDYDFWIEVVVEGNTYWKHNPGLSSGIALVTANANQLTTQAEMERLFGPVAIELRSDDGANIAETADIINEMANWATETVEAYTLSHYDTENLVSSAWTRRRATVLACHYLSTRRGNPAQYAAAAKQVLEDLEMIQKGKLIIPGVVVRAASIPVASRYLVDDRYPISKQRVVRSQSTGGYPGQKFYEIPFTDYWI